MNLRVLMYHDLLVKRTQVSERVTHDTNQHGQRKVSFGLLRIFTQVEEVCTDQSESGG
jgi:hypothetical protein